MSRMDDQRSGRVVRMLRQRRGWRQVDLASLAGCSQSLVSLIERGHLDRISLRRLRRVLAALDAWSSLEVRWRGPDLDRLLDARHARIVDAVAARLRMAGWTVEVEVTYSEFGERGSFDLLAFHPRLGVVLAVEVKTELVSVEATLRKLDEKERLAATVALKRFGWQARSVSRLLVIAEGPTARRRVQRHAALFSRAFPARNVAVRRWLRKPVGRLSGLWFFSDSNGRSGKSDRRRPDRVRGPNSAGDTNAIAE